jgi:diacylglycerol kinase (ATP)
VNPVHVILNPNSAGSRGARVRPRLEAALSGAGRAYRLHLTAAAGHARTLALEIVASGAEGPLLVVGGDGTIHEVANGLLESGEALRFPLAVLPMGTGNDFHRMVECAGGMDAVLGLLDTGRIRRFDVGFARWEGGQAYFVNLLGVGIDVEVLRRRSRFHRLSGLPQYMAALLSALLRFQPVELELELEGEGGAQETLVKSILMAAVTVGPTVGGGFRLSPRARPDDGLLDLFLVEPLGPLEVVRYLPRVLRGTHGREPTIHLRTLRKLRIMSVDRKPFAFELDGELAPVETSWLELELRPAALSVLDLPGSPGGEDPSPPGTAGSS